MTKSPKIAYKIESKSNWEQALQLGKYEGSVLDKKDGFIHLSSGVQLAKTFELHFAGKLNLVVAAIDLQQLGDAVTWEKSRGGELFPHIYGNLPASAIIETMEVSYGADGTGSLPNAIRRHEI